ncbi:uncharacterized protein LOC110446379 [Mizuhopecten yessoensis]|uniref:Complement C1q tumor necrosis factor-related protein 7 n=1 Tax=Mizuhopecten yessoensis TaxID=6573 RepID=A0A210QXL0_MIZYE|nr:uncharacterized protein LOC110446379 [Mizuhopecten yessoensis]OWF53464.1 Complement C1q tumor necrosis factor-related protein 7 [Mizuhopecten yessoensis]
MEGIQLLKLMLYILILVMGERITAASMIQQPTVSSEQANTPIEQLAMLTKRMDEFEQSRSDDMKDLNIRVQDLAESRKNYARVMTELNQEVAELQRLRVKDLNLIALLTQRVRKVEQQCENGEEAGQVISKETQISSGNETAYFNTSHVTLPSRASHERGEAKPTNGDLSTHFPKTPSSESVSGQGRIRSIHHGKITRVSPSDDIVVFHAVLTHTISNPSTRHPVIFNRLVTNTGGAHYSTNTGVFTCTQSGVYVFSWSTNVEGHQYIDSELVRNNYVIGSAVTGQGTGFESATSATSAAHLQVGDEIWVRVAGHGSGSDILPNRSMFTGFLLR